MRNPNTGKYDRLPWNVGVLNYEVSPGCVSLVQSNGVGFAAKYTLSFQTLIEETVSREIYEDTHSIVKEMLKEKTFKVDAGLSFKFKNSESSLANVSVEAGLNFSKNELIRDVIEYSKIKVNIRTANHEFQVVTRANNFHFEDVSHLCLYC